MPLSEHEKSLFTGERESYRRLTEEIGGRRKGSANEGVELVCIGEAAGAHAVTSGLPSGGFLMRTCGRSVIVDPGANSISFLSRHGVDPYEITDVAATHAHNDHVGNLTLAVSAARLLGLGGASDARILICPSLVDYLHFESTRFGFTLPSFALDQEVAALSTLDRRVRLPDGSELVSARSASLPGCGPVRATPTRHGAIEGVGFVFDTPFGRLGYSGDTGYFPGLEESFGGCDLLWLNMNTLGLRGMKDTDGGGSADERLVESHLGYVGVCRMIEAVGPAVAVVTHFGAQLLDMADAIGAALRDRFAGSGCAIHVARGSDVLGFPRSLRQAPALGRLAAG